MIATFRLFLILFTLTTLVACGPSAGEVVEETSTVAGGDSTAQTFQLDFQELSLPERQYLVFRQELAFVDMNGFIGMESKALRQAIAEAGITATGPFTLLTYEWDTERGWGDCAVAFPVAAGTELSPYVTITLPATEALALELVGPYDGLSAFHIALDQELKRRGLAPELPAIEAYHFGPEETDQPEDFRTTIIYPYKSTK